MELRASSESVSIESSTGSCSRKRSSSVATGGVSAAHQCDELDDEEVEVDVRQGDDLLLGRGHRVTGRVTTQYLPWYSSNREYDSRFWLVNNWY